MMRPGFSEQLQRFARTSLLGLAVLAAPSALAAETTRTAAAASAAGEKPNILLYIADDMSWAHAGAAGEKAIETPNIDRVAKNGIRFTHAFVSAPSCTPSRGAILTGQAFCRLEEGANLLSTLHPKFPVYPELLEKAGYQTGRSGKGLGPGDPLAAGRTRRPEGKSYRSFQAFLKDLTPGRPFCFWAGSSDPHRPYKPGSGVRSGIDPAKITVPSIAADTPEMRRDLADYLFEVQRFDRDLGVLLKTLDEAGLSTNTLVVVTSDNGMPYPRGKSNLYDWGTRVPLMISWPAKVRPGRVIDDFVSLTDLAPAFLQAAGVAVPAEMTGRSLLPILLSEKSGQVDQERNKVFTGRERHDVFRRENGQPVGYPMRAVRTRDFLYIRNFKPERVPAGEDPGANEDNGKGPAKAVMVGLRDDPARRAYYDRAYAKRPAEELYDLARDPGQITNVAGRPEYAKAQADLRTELERWMTSVNDPRRPGGPDPDVFDRYPVHRSPRH